MTRMDSAKAAYLAEKVPGLNPNRVWIWPQGNDLVTIQPIVKLSKRDRKALHAAGYAWWGRWWQKIEE